MASEKRKSTLLLRIVLVVIIAAALGLSLIWEKQINAALGFVQEEETAPPDGTTATSIDLDIHFVDVGQGDACILELPDDRVMLIDSGSDDDDDKLIKYIDSNIRRNGNKLDYFDIVLITHTDEDHCGEMGDVLNRYPAKTFYRPNVAATNKGYVDPGIAANDLYGDYGSKNTVCYKEAIEAGYAKIGELGGESFATNALDPEQNVIQPEGVAKDAKGYYTLTLYTPTQEKYTKSNNYSPIMILEYEGKRIALSGDAETETEREFTDLATAGGGKFSVFSDAYYVNLIKLGHHGSDTSSSQAYLDAITTSASCPATFVVISCGKDNSYGHPKPSVLERLNAMGFKQENILRTDELSSIVATVKLNDRNVYDLFIGGATAGTVNAFAWRWLYVAGIILLAAIVVLLVLPFILRNRKYFEVKRKK